MSTLRCAMLVVCGCLAAVPLAATRAVAQSAVEREIRPLLGEQMAAANAHDTDRFLATYLRDSSLVLVFNGAVIVGYDSVRALQLTWWNHGKSDVVYSERAPASVRSLSSTAAVVIQELASRRTGADGKPVSGNVAVMSVWEKRAEGWRVVSIHESTAR
jgi:uncharacterized protein (TIGR02246 family)